MRLLLVSLAVLGLAVACAPTEHWEHPTWPKERWQADLETCKRLAWREAEKEYAKERRLSGTDYAGQENTLDARMAAYDISKYDQAQIDACMVKKGYRKVEGRAQ